MGSMSGGKKWDFVHLHVHSEYSLLDGAARVSQVAQLAKELGMGALAITDHGCMFGAVEFYKACRKQGINPILGCEVYISPRKMTDRTPKLDDQSYHLVLLAENPEGYKNLLRLVSLGHTEGFYYKPRVDKETLARYSKGLIALSGCLAGEVAHNVLAGQLDQARVAASDYRDIFGNENYYLELQDHGMVEQRTANRELLKIAGQLQLPMVATNDVHYLGRQHAYIQDVLLCIQTGKSINTPGRMKFDSQEMYLKSPDEMALLFGEIPESLSNTVRIAERCKVDLEFGKLHLPHFAVPSGYSTASYLREQCLAGLVKKYGNYSSEVLERLNYELQVIGQMGFEEYFLIVWDFIKYAREKGIAVGPGRGSAAGSIVAYALEITNIDPIKYGLLFERFLNPERISMPDIDIDFDYERRGEVIDYIVKKYGSERVAQIITFGTMAARAAIRDVGRALDMPYGEVDRVAKMVPGELNMTIDKALRVAPDLKAVYDQNPSIKNLVDTALELEGMPRHASTHAAGLVISREPLVEYLPLSRTSEGLVTTQFPMGTVEELGLLKMDLLGLRNLTVIEETIRIIEQFGIKVDIDKLPLDDHKTFAMLAKGEGVGVFQLESSGMRSILKELKPNAFEDIVALVALYRPGPLGSGMVEDYIQRKHGATKVDYYHDDLVPILGETYGVILYQEQVMMIARIMAGYTLGQADSLRKAMGKKIPSMMALHREWFIYGAEADEKGNKLSSPIPGALARGYELSLAQKMFDLMEYFAGYGFNKSHSAAYALVSYQTAYLKANYPVEYMAALLTSVRDNTNKVVLYIEECRRMDIKVLPPDINYSRENFTVSQGAIRFGLAAVKNVGWNAVHEFIQVRQREGIFKDFWDFCSRIDTKITNRRVMESLIKAGALDKFGHRAQLLAGLETGIEHAIRTQRDREQGQVSLFDLLPGSPQDTMQLVLPEVPRLNIRDQLEYEKEALGLYISGHPLSELSWLAEGVEAQRVAELQELVDGQTVALLIMVSSIKRITSRRGEPMAFIMAEDLTGACEIVIFSDTYKRYGNLLNNKTPLLIRGKLNNGGEEAKVLAEEILTVEELSPQVWLKFSEKDRPKINEILQQFPGNAPVVFYNSLNGEISQVDKVLWVSPLPELRASLAKVLGTENVKLKCSSGSRLKVTTRGGESVREDSKVYQAKLVNKPEVKPQATQTKVDKSHFFDPEKYILPQSLLDI